jgi:hypothetical protein
VVGVNCIDAGEILSPFLDGELAREDERKLLEHLEGCPACSRELDEIRRVAAALSMLGQKQITAPAGFSSAVMARINEDKAGSTNKYRHLKQVAMGAAAVLLLAAGVATIKPELAGQVAQAPVQMESSGAPQTGAVNPDQKSPASESTGTPDQQNPSSAENSDPSSDKIVAENPNQGSGLYSASGSIEFTGDKEYIIVSTFLKFKVADSAEAEEQARSLAREYGVSMQSLGQQTIDGKQCLVEKIVVSSSNAQSLTASLRALGTLVSQDEQKADLTQRYGELYDKYITLKSERAQTQDTTQAAQLDQQIKKAEEQLRAWEQQSSNQTIVLWLQQ